MLGIASVFGLDAIRSLSGAGLNSALPIIITDLIIFMFVPALYVASKIVKDRPFSSYSSSRGGWNFKLYFKALIIPLILYIIFQFIEITVNGARHVSIFNTVPDCNFHYCTASVHCRGIHVSRTSYADIRVMV